MKFLLLQRLISVTLLLSVMIGSFNYPVIRIWLIAGLIIYFLIIIRYPCLSFFVLPALLPILNLAPWSGWFLVEEFDFIIIATIAMGFWKGIYFNRQSYAIGRFALAVLVAFSVSISISAFKGLSPISPFTVDAWSNYLNPYNSLRISRSFFYGLMMLPVIVHYIRTNHKSVQYGLMMGYSFGVLGVGILVFWERGVFWSWLHAKNIYDIFSRLLDLSTEYRTTAFFSEMHTGGSAIDGFIASAWIFSFGACWDWWKSIRFTHESVKQIPSGVLFLSSIMMACYIIATTFTRITYLSVGLTGLLLGVSLLFTYRDNPEKFPKSLILFFLFSAAVLGIIFYKSYRLGGFIALFLCLFILIGGGFAGAIHSRAKQWQILSCYSIFFCIGSWLIARAMVTSKYVDISTTKAMLFSMGMAFSLLLIGSLLSSFSSKKNQLPNFIGAAVPVVVLMLISVPVLSGFQIQKRISESGKDALTRFDHWQDVLAAMNTDLWTRMTGMGLGTFPRSFLKTNSHAKNIGSFFYKTDGEHQYIRLTGGSDLEIGQRLTDIQKIHGKEYTLHIKSRVDKPGELHVRFCNRNLMLAKSCQYYKILLDKTGRWNDYYLPIRRESIRDIDWCAEWPIVFLFRNFSTNTRIDLDEIDLLDDAGGNIIVNGSFKLGGQRWFPYNEFEHLPWHTKNMWLHLFFETGVMGMICFLAATLIACQRAWQYFLNRSNFGLYLLGSMAGFMVVSITGSLIDAPRVFFLYLMTVCLSLALFPIKQNQSPL